jgi:hypothetical protein
VEGGITRGNNRNALPPPPKFEPSAAFTLPKDAMAVADGIMLEGPVTIDGIYVQHVPKAASMQLVAARPDGDVEPLLWLYEYQDRFQHPFLFRKPLTLLRGTVIHGVRGDAKVFLIPTARSAQ